MNSLSLALIDFEDSFTHNIAEIFHRLGHRVEVIHFSHIDLCFNFSCFDIICLGPGPGHIQDYQKMIDILSQRLSELPPLLGICLGHQMIGVLHGLDLKRLDTPIHGRSLCISESLSLMGDISGDTQQLGMFYNSWSLVGECSTLELAYQYGQIIALKGRNCLGFQFHPESVGTSFPLLLLDAALFSLYNKRDEGQNADHRSIRPENSSFT